MHFRVSGAGGLRTVVAVLESGEEAIAELTRLAEAEAISGASLSGLGAVRSATVAWYDLERQEYEKYVLDEQLEVLTLSGNAGRYDGSARLHVHATLGRRGGAAVGGHLMECTVRPTLEVVIREAGTALNRSFDAACGLPLLDLGG